ncbi:MAG TPA: phosphatase PAP2 family protein [Anaerolineales bacterium]|nr:phosphatase PAP2 family protein [Anaerolineales bacterium]
MATNSRIQAGLPATTLSGDSRRDLRAPGLFARWPMIGITMFLLGSLLFGTLAINVVDKNPALSQWDQSTGKTFQTQEKSIPSSIGEYVIFGFFVGREIIITIGTILAIYFFHKRFWREFMMVMWGPGLGGLLWFTLSRYFDRPRPSTQLDVLAITDPSFPSGHVLSAVLLYGLLAYLLVPKMPSRFWKWFVAILAIGVTVWVALSRLLVGGHYLSDVVAGYAVGIAWAGLVYTLAERFFPREQTVSTTLTERPKTDDELQGLRAPGMFKKWPILGLILILFGSLSFAALGYSLLTHSPLVQLDQSIYETLIAKAKTAPARINELMIFGFFLGKQVPILIVTLLSIYFVYKRYWRELAMILLSSGAGSFVWNFFVNYFGRPRPAIQTGLAVRAIPSFPSGHTMSAIIVYGFLTYLLLPKMPSRFWKWTLVIAMAAVILFDGFSRIFQGSHYLTDVVGGYALGIAWAALVYTVIEVIFIRKKV